MKLNSITFKLLFSMVGVFAVTAISLLILSDYQLTHIIDASQRAVYTEKIEAIRDTLTISNERLKQTGLVEAYEKDFKQESLKVLRKTYYKHAPQQIYPFIVNEAGEVVLHPVLPQGDRSLEHSEVVSKMLAADEGDFDYTYLGQKKWCLFKRFPAWGWVIGYTVPLDIKYADVRKFSDFLVLLMGGMTILVLLVLLMFFRRFTRPIINLTRTAKAMADGDLDRQIDLGGADEVGTLARSFSHMRDSIRQTISELKKENVERRKTEQALRESEEQYQALVNNVDLGITYIDRNHNIVLTNDAQGRIFGKPKTYFRGKKCFREYEKRGEVCAHCPGVIAMATGEPAEMVTEGAREDGSRFTARIKAFPVRHQDSGKGGFIEVVEDISREVQADKVIHALVEGTVGSIGQDLYDRIVSQLAGWLACEIALLGRFDSEDGKVIPLAMQVDGKMVRDRLLQVAGSPFEVTAGNDFSLYRQGVAEIFSEDTTLTDLGANGYVGVPLRGKKGEAIGVLCAISRHRLSPPPRVEEVMDIFAARAVAEMERHILEEEKLEIEKQLQHVQKLESLGVMAGGIAHDFNNLLMGVMGNADLAQLKLSEVSPAYGNIGAIKVAAQRAAELCQQMLAYSGRGRFVIQALNLNDVVREMTHIFEVSISKKAALKFNLADNLPSVSADATQIRQVLMNLVVNASEAIGDESGVISISTGAHDCDQAYLADIYIDEKLPEGIYVYLEVSDTGCGMDEKTRSKLFDPFFTTKFTGRGLGLSAVLGIIRGHKGGIKVYSEPGKGTTFKLLFPALEEALVEKSLENNGREEGWRGKGTILLVDDEDIVLVVGKEMIEHLGFKVLTATDGREAIRVFEHHRDEIDGVILDLTMPRMDGNEAFRELRRIRPEVRVFMSSGFNEQEINERFSGKGFAGFIQKPYQMQTLAAKLREVFG